MRKHDTTDLSHKSTFSAFFTRLSHRGTTLKAAFINTKKAQSSCLPWQLPPTSMETYPAPHHGTRNPYLPHTLYLVAPAETGAVQQQKLCALPQQTGWESRSLRAPKHPATDTRFGFFFFPPQILNFSFDYSLPALQRGFKDFDVLKMRIRPGSKPRFTSCCWSPASTDQLPPRLWPRPPPPHMAQSLGLGLLTAVLISTSIPECSKRQSWAGRLLDCDPIL